MIRLQDIRLRHKLTALLLLCGLIPVWIQWSITTYQNDQLRINQLGSQLETVRHIALADIKRHMAERRADLELLTQVVVEQQRQARTTLEALRDLKKERIEHLFNAQLTDVTQLAANPDFTKRVAAIDWLFRQGGRKTDDKPWRDTVEGFVPPLHGRPVGQGFEDLFFISPHGDIVYSLHKQAELGQSLTQKPWKESALAQAHKAALEAPVIQDFQPYPPNAPVPTVFIGAPVKKDGTTIGTVIIRFSRTYLTQLLHAGVDPASGHELLLLASDGLRSDPPANRTHEPLPQTLISSLMEGKSNSGVLTPSGRSPMLAAWAPLQIKGLHWTILVAKEAARLFGSPEKEQRSWLHQFSESSGYYDLFLVHPDGNVFYTSAKQADYATNLLTGRFATTNLGQLIQRVLKTKQAGLSDLQPYPPSDNQPAIFMAQPVIDHGQVVLIAALQLAPDAITNLLYQLSQSNPYRIFLVGPDERLRSDAFTDAANPSTATAFIGGAATTVVSTHAIQNALAGETGTYHGPRNDGKTVLSAYAPLAMDGFLWGVIVEINLSENTPPLHPVSILLGMLLCVALLTVAGSLFLQHDLLGPLRATAFTLNRMASGHFTATSTSARRDEIGTLTRSVHTVSTEISQAGQRIQAAADPLAVRIRRLASLAMVISRESAVGSETLQEAKTTLLDNARQSHDESVRLLQDRKRLLGEQTTLLHDSERMAGLTAQAVVEGKQVVSDSMTAWNHLHTRLRHLQEATRQWSRLVQEEQQQGKGSKHGKGHGKEHAAQQAQNRIQCAIQTELDALTRLIDERLTTSENAISTLDALLPAMPMPQQTESDLTVLLDHSPEKTLMALERLDGLLKKNQATAREIILAAKGVFDLTTGPLHQATSYFVPHEVAIPEPVSSNLTPQPTPTLPNSFGSEPTASV
ncbi:MAG: methyl-accepting chemotaxis protein [Magnetococcales bacterium]|nr:methyl-accepting chemotaxis protein [Magnetococcales bacterium]